VDRSKCWRNRGTFDDVIVTEGWQKQNEEVNVSVALVSEFPQTLLDLSCKTLTIKELSFSGVCTYIGTNRWKILGYSREVSRSLDEQLLDKSE